MEPQGAARLLRTSRSRIFRDLGGKLKKQNVISTEGRENVKNNHQMKRCPDLLEFPSFKVKKQPSSLMQKHLGINISKATYHPCEFGEAAQASKQMFAFLFNVVNNSVYLKQLF